MKFKSLIVLLFLFSISLYAQTVYITKTGSKYHSAGCRYLKKSSIPIDLKEAVKKYSPCSVCKPPTDVDEKTTKKEQPKAEETKSNASTYNGRTIYTGPRGGQYYINKNGKKTYIKKK